MKQPPRKPRCRLRDLGISIGRFPTGPHNAITDIPGVRVGHATLIRGEGPLVAGRGPVRTGVTAILQNDNPFYERVIAGSFVLNGAGEVSGITQITEWGFLETPIMLTHSMAVGRVTEATARWMVRHYPGIGDFEDVVLPVVGECDDSSLNDSAGVHVRAVDVKRAIESAKGGPVAEGSVGAGTGMITCDFKAGIGTSSRQVPSDEGVYTIGILVLSNFGKMADLRVDGVQVGAYLEPKFRHLQRRQRTYGSIITILGTDAPLLPSQITRLCKRAALGIGRTGSYADHTSGEILVGFSTGNQIPRKTTKMTHHLEAFLDEHMSPLYEATVEATEEAILNALCQANEMKGVNDFVAPALPLEEVQKLVGKHRPPRP